MSTFSMSGTIQFSPKLVDGGITWADSVARLLSFTNGSGSGQADAYWHKSITLGPGGNETINFLSLEFTPFGGSGTVALAYVKMLVVTNESANVTITVEPGASDGWDQMGGAYVGKGGAFVMQSGVDGLPVGSTTKTLKITNNGAVVTLVGDTTSGSAVVNMADTTGLAVGMVASGAGIPSGAKIASIVASTSVTLTANATATATGVSVDFQWPDAVVNVYAVGVAD